tara:strand:+ start:200 stop:580 length:381 start_codon:yes stop_codon:yes gene_type:complete
MNTNIKTFLDNYSCEEKEPGVWWSDFTKTRTLHKLRDNLTEKDWEDLADFARQGFWDMPPNLRKSAQQKFDKFEQWCVDNRVNGYSFPTILDAAMQTPDQRYAQTLIWGVVTSCIEAGYWSMQEID